MDFFRVFITAPISLTVLFLLAKLMGNKQMSELNMFDYINGITRRTGDRRIYRYLRRCNGYGYLLSYSNYVDFPIAKVASSKKVHYGQIYYNLR